VKNSFFSVFKRVKYRVYTFMGKRWAHENRWRFKDLGG
jgi:hypothetical protein